MSIFFLNQQNTTSTCTLHLFYILLTCSLMLKLFLPSSIHTQWPTQSKNTILKKFCNCIKKKNLKYHCDKGIQTLGQQLQPCAALCMTYECRVSLAVFLGSSSWKVNLQPSPRALNQVFIKDLYRF